MATLHGVQYDPKYKWRPTHAWDNCPGCFECFDFDYQCDTCGSGKEVYNPNTPEMITAEQLRVMTKAVAKAQSDLAKLKRQHKKERREKRKEEK